MYVKSVSSVMSDFLLVHAGYKPIGWCPPHLGWDFLPVNSTSTPRAMLTRSVVPNQYHTPKIQYSKSLTYKHS